MKFSLAMYSFLVALVTITRFGHVKRRLRVLLHRVPMTMGSFWFSGSFKLTESIQRQEFAASAYLTLIGVVITSSFAGLSLALQRESNTPILMVLILALGCVFYCLRGLKEGFLRSKLTTWLLLVTHGVASALAMLVLLG